MTPATFIVLLPALFGLAGTEAVQKGDQTILARSEFIIRIPLRPPTAPPAIEWVERRGPRCIASEGVRGATLGGPEHVDFLMLNRSRIRAEFAEDCPALDFYSGFYLSPEDEWICAGRDSIRSRMGGSCRIEKFHRLQPRLKRQSP